ncbi:MAG: class I SAM-dependent methyltransferase [Streptosporangiaceae bacterium]
MDGVWNANIHDDARLAACVPGTAAAVLNVGCGDGFLAARLARRVPLVVAIDTNAPVLGRARARFPDAPVTWCHGDILTSLLERESFDAVVSNAALHHLPDARAALRRLSHLVRPGGTLAIAGFIRTEWRDWPWAVTAFISLGAANRLHGRWEHTAPQAWPPRDTFRQLRQAAREILPGARIRHRLMRRYLLTWTRPLTDPGGPVAPRPRRADCLGPIGSAGSHRQTQEPGDCCSPVPGVLRPAHPGVGASSGT